MRADRIGDALILRAGVGEWYNQPGRGLWDMGEDAADLPPARWHQEVQAAIRSQEWHPSIVIIDAAEMTYLVGQDYGFLVELSKTLKPAGIKLVLVARANEVQAFASLPSSWHEYLNLVGTLDEALQGQ